MCVLFGCDEFFYVHAYYCVHYYNLHVTWYDMTPKVFTVLAV